MRRFRKPLRRTRIQRDPVTPQLHAAVLTRDRACVAWIIDRSHVCRDAWGNPHAPGDLGRLTIEHVKTELRYGKRADSDLEHTVALCYGSNVGVPSKQLRTAMREYLRTVQEPEHPHVDPTPGCAECARVFVRVGRGGDTE